MSDWLDWLNKIKEEFNNNKDSFLQQENISRTIHPQHGGNNVYQHLKSKVDYLDKLQDQKFGKPKIKFDNKFSLTSIESTYHILKLKEFFNIEPKDLDRVTDIGGGYGYLCYSFHQLGFKGNYTICDFEIMNNIQNHYLTNTLDNANYNCVTLIPENLSTNIDNSFLIGTYSISEMPLNDRQIIEPYYKEHKYIMIIYKGNAKFGVDNLKYFDKLKNSLSETHNTTYYKCPLRKNDHYLISEKK